MPTREEVKKARETWSDIAIEMREKCIMCNKWSYWDVHIVKIPEWVDFCLYCWDKYKDDKVYKWIEWCWMVYIIWEGFI